MTPYPRKLRLCTDCINRGNLEGEDGILGRRVLSKSCSNQKDRYLHLSTARNLSMSIQEALKPDWLSAIEQSYSVVLV